MREIISKGAIAFGLKMVGTGLAFAFNIAIARLLGPSGSGLYFLALTFITIISVIARMGLENSVTRLVAANASEDAWSIVKGVVRQSLWISLAASLVLSISLYYMAEWVATVVFHKPELTAPLAYMSIAILPFTWLTILAKALQGLRNVRDSMLLQSVLIPLISLPLLFVLVPASGVNGAVAAYCVAVTLAAMYGLGQWRRRMHSYREIAAQCDKGELMSSSYPLLGAMLVEQLTTSLPLLLLGAWSSSSDAGLYSAANRAAMLVGLVLIAANSIIAPKMATLYRQGDMESLERITRQSALLLTAMASPAIFVFLIAPHWVMSLFGSQFTDAWLLLVVLALGQLVNVMTGSVGFLLMMTGRGKSYLGANLVALAVCVGLSAALIPWFGGLGAAIASAMSVALVNLLRVRFIWHEMGIMVLPIPFFRNMK